MAITFNDLPLTAAQKIKMQAFSDLGALVPGGMLEQPIAGVIPTGVTVSDAKRAIEWLKDLKACLARTEKGILYTLLYNRYMNAKAFEDANP